MFWGRDPAERGKMKEAIAQVVKFKREKEGEIRTFVQEQIDDFTEKTGLVVLEVKITGTNTLTEEGQVDFVLGPVKIRFDLKVS